MTDENITFFVDGALKKRFSAAALAAGSDSADVLRELMLVYITEQQSGDASYDAWLRREVQVGIDQADAGDLISDDDVEAESAAWREYMRRKVVDPAP